MTFLRVIESLPLGRVLLATYLTCIRIGKNAAVLRLDMFLQIFRILHRNETDAAGHADLVPV